MSSSQNAPTTHSIEPTLQFCVFCDIVAQAPGNKPALIGVFDRFLSLGPIPQFFIATRWIGGIGQHTASMRILDPNLNPIYSPPQRHPINLPDKTSAATGNYGIVNLKFPEPGVYWVQILLNDQPYASFPLPVYSQ
jgi:hypothetical protein